MESLLNNCVNPEILKVVKAKYKQEAALGQFSSEKSFWVHDVLNNIKVQAELGKWFIFVKAAV